MNEIRNCGHCWYFNTNLEECAFRGYRGPSKDPSDTCENWRNDSRRYGDVPNEDDVVFGSDSKTGLTSKEIEFVRDLNKPRNTPGTSKAEVLHHYPDARCESFGDGYQVILGRPRIIGATEYMAWANAALAIELGDTTDA